MERDDLTRCRAVSKRLHALITPVFADRLDEFQVILDPKPGFDGILCQLFLEEQDASKLKYSNFFFRDMDMTTPICAVLFSAMGLNMGKLKLKFKDDSTALSRGILADILRNKAPFLEESSLLCSIIVYLSDLFLIRLTSFEWISRLKILFENLKSFFPRNFAGFKMQGKSSCKFKIS